MAMGTALVTTPTLGTAREISPTMETARVTVNPGETARENTYFGRGLLVLLPATLGTAHLTPSNHGNYSCDKQQIGRLLM